MTPTAIKSGKSKSDVDLLKCMIGNGCASSVETIIINCPTVKASNIRKTAENIATRTGLILEHEFLVSRSYFKSARY